MKDAKRCKVRKTGPHRIGVIVAQTKWEALGRKSLLLNSLKRARTLVVLRTHRARLILLADDRGGGAALMPIQRLKARERTGRWTRAIRPWFREASAGLRVNVCLLGNCFRARRIGDGQNGERRRGVRGSVMGVVPAGRNVKDEGFVFRRGETGEAKNRRN